MTAPYEKTKLAGYDVQRDGDEPGDGFHYLRPDGDDVPETYATEDEAWQAAEHDRLFGETLKPKRRMFRVVWEIDVEAVTPWEAAQKARAAQRPDTSAVVFTCHADGLETVTVDLADEHGVER